MAGLGLEEKYSIAVFGFAVVVGLLLTEQRRFLLSQWMWLGGLTALLIFLPNLLWNIKPSEHSHMWAVLPQHYADQFGWQEIVDEVNLAWQKIPPAERGNCAVFAQDYGQARAIDLLGRKYGLPKALSGHQTYFLWGPRGYSGNCMIVLMTGAAVSRRSSSKSNWWGTP